jgi:6,7-dimethyl-8-ribityllumazine synthase
LSSRRAPTRLASAFAPDEVEGEPDAAGLRLTVLCSRWNPSVTDAMLASCLAALERRGARSRDVKVVRVPGAFELPAAASAAVASRRVDAVVALGAIIRGETAHHDVLGHAVAGALAALSASRGVPIGFGLLTCDTIEQARRRCGKGAEAAEAAVEMARLRQRLGRGRRGKRRYVTERLHVKRHPSERPARRSHAPGSG